MKLGPTVQTFGPPSSKREMVILWTNFARPLSIAFTGSWRSSVDWGNLMLSWPHRSPPQVQIVDHPVGIGVQEHRQVPSCLLQFICSSLTDQSPAGSCFLSRRVEAANSVQLRLQDSHEGVVKRLRMDGSLVLDWWDVATEVLRSSKSSESPTHQAAGNRSRNHKSEPKQRGNRDVDQLSHVDYITTNADSSQGESQLQFLRTRKQWSKWSLKAEVQQWDTCQEPTELFLIDHSTESIWTPRSKSKCWHPKPTRRHVNQRKFHTWSVGPSLSFVEYQECIDVFLQPFAHRKQSVMSKTAHESTSKEGSAVAKPRPMNFVSRNFLGAGIKNWIRVVFHPAAGNWRETSNQTQQCILKRGEKMTLNFPAPGNWDG